MSGSFAKLIVFSFLAALVLCSVSALPVDACTAIAAGKNATVDGSVIVTHANDVMRDFRIVRVPGRQYRPNSLRPVYYDYSANGYLPAYGGVPYLRYVGKDRGPTYNTGQSPNIPVGWIPQVSRTAAYYEGTYPIMNEHQVSIGETTCMSKVTPKPSEKRLFYSAELSRIALERCTTAKEAVALIGSLIDTYGYHGTGECLIVGDKEEAWVIEMCGYAEDGSGGLWVAKRIPDDEVFVSANQFRIREVDPQSEDMMYSKNLFKVCQELGWWSPGDGPLDWVRAVSEGETPHPYYSLRRVWRIFSQIKPSAGFSPKVDNWDTRAYPFSIKPDRKLGVADIMALHRDVYQGTSFDLTTGPAAGAFGDPNRFDVQDNAPITGAFERPLSTYRCNYIDVTQARSWLPDPVGGLVWVGLSEAERNCFIPFHVGVTQMPRTLDHGDYMHLDMDCAWWVFNLVCEVMSSRYDLISRDVAAVRAQLETASMEMLEKTEKRASSQWAHGDKGGCAATLSRFAMDRTKTVVDSWRNLWGGLQVKYLKNYMVDKNGNLIKMGYPVDWLKAVGYQDGPVRYDKAPGGAK